MGGCPLKDILLGKPESKIEFKPKVFECMRSKMELGSLNGCLDKPFWAQTRFSEEFEDILWNKNSKKPYKATRVKMLYDDKEYSSKVGTVAGSYVVKNAGATARIFSEIGL